MQSPIGLEALNFAMAGAREGFGPFFGVFLQSRGFDPAATRLAMSLASVAGVVATTPLSAFVDRIQTKHGAVALAVLDIAAGAGLIVLTGSLWVVALGQVLIGVADTSLAPLVSALTLGIVGRARDGTAVDDFLEIGSTMVERRAGDSMPTRSLLFLRSTSPRRRCRSAPSV